MTAVPGALLRADPAAGLGGPWWRFAAPKAVLRAERAEEVPALLREVEGAAAAGLWAVGLVAYEAAPGFDPALATRRAAAGGGAAVPAAWFALFGEPAAGDVPPPAAAGSLSALRLRPTLSDAAYLAGVEAVRDAIARGDTYQANLTYRLRGSLAGGPEALALFAALDRNQPSPYAAYLELGEQAVCSVSPELFFERRGRRLLCRPMKGTAPRGRTAAEDRELAAALRSSPKERAENLMIVDMVRNDLGRIARPGSVSVRSLFDVARYPTVHQMTSDVEAESGAGLAEAFGALFPSASVTGAPKVRTMEILAGLETSPRGVYTGAVGWVAPGGDARFSVAIRTAWIDRGARAPWTGEAVGDGEGAHGEGAGGPWIEYGTGGGIVWDSVPERELAETRTKALILTASRAESFQLLETLLWRPRMGFFLLRRHRERLAASAEYFERALDFTEIERRLHDLDRRLRSGGAGADRAARRRVRLLVDASGAVSLEAAPLERTRRPWRVALAAEPVDPADPFLRHKTTRREVYDRALAEVRRRRPGLDDVLLWNPAGELTESTVANLVLRLDGELLTPPAAAGLLPGTLRSELLSRGRIEEATLTLADLARAEGLDLVNSLRGWLPARLVLAGAEPPAAPGAWARKKEAARGVARKSGRRAPVSPSS
ncbi:MAG TPA: chorismate-binding protein [Thermoanaerobaculia bacterium]|nr:chorismate-binding protein [Thermoanaerobaculia bacterium]